MRERQTKPASDAKTLASRQAQPKSIDFNIAGACKGRSDSPVSALQRCWHTLRGRTYTRAQTTEPAGAALQTGMFKKRQAKAGGARKTTPKVQAGNTTGAPSLLSFGGDEDEGPTFEVKKRKLKQKKKRKEEPMSTPAPQPVTDYSAAGLAALRGSQKALPAELLEESTRAAEEAAQQVEEEPAEDTAARARKARVARASSRAAAEELDRAVHVEDFDARHMSEDDASDDGLGGRATAQDFVPVPGRANYGIAARLQDEERRRWLKAGADAGDVDAPAAPGGAMDAALRKAGGLNEDDDELEAHEAEVARRGAATRAVAGAVLPEAAPRRRPTTYQDVYATVATRADELEIGEGEWEPRRRLKEACDHAKAEAAQAERQVEARRAALQAWEGSVSAAAADEAAASKAIADLAKARKIVEEAEAAVGAAPDDMGLARLRAALAEAASVVATAASDDGAAPADFFAVYASGPVPDEPAPPAPVAAGPPRAAATDFF